LLVSITRRLLPTITAVVPARHLPAACRPGGTMAGWGVMMVNRGTLRRHTARRPAGRQRRTPQRAGRAPTSDP
jgi:hypothetical protein